MAYKFSWYNGYSPQERADHLEACNHLMSAGELAPATGPCALCGDPDAPVEYHAENYALPYRWTAPAAYALCQNCHRHKLHSRFSRPELWQAFLAHVRRGGYARDLKDTVIKQEFKAYRSAVARGEPSALRQLRPYTKNSGTEWFANLRMDIGSLRDPKARPR